MEYREAVEDRKHDIQDGEVVGPAGGSDEAPATVVLAIESVTSFGKEFFHHGAQFLVVVDEQQRQLDRLFRAFHHLLP